METVRALDGLYLQYRQCVRDHQAERERFRGMFDVLTEEMMRVAEQQGTDAEEEEPMLLVTKGRDSAVDESAVIADVMLQHKQALLEGWVLAEEVWQLQAETWARKCGICRIREGRRVKHDWRGCPAYPQDREMVEQAHREVEQGMLSVDEEEVLEGRCGGCDMSRTSCWLEVRQRADMKGCKYHGVVTESVAAILAIGPDMVRQWEEREGRRRGAGANEVRRFAGQRFGGMAVGRVWRTFGWVGIWDIRGAKVDEVRSGYQRRLQTMTQQVEGETEGVGKRKELYGVRDGKIGGWGAKDP